MTVTNLTPPTISGTAQVGQTLLADPGTWSHTLPDISYAYQWERCDAAGANCNDITNAHGQQYGLVQADLGSTIRVEVTATESTAPAPSTAYFDETWADGDFDWPPWSSLFSYTAPGFVDQQQSGSHTQTPDGRVAVVANPSGPGNAVRYEIRDSDPGWPNNTQLQKSESRTVPQYTWNQSSAPVGGVRWFSREFYLPYGAEKFEWAHSGSNNYTDLGDLHPGSGSAWPAFSFNWYPTSGDVNTYFKIRVAGGPTINSTQYLEEINLWALTDGSGNRVMANHNVWKEVIWGMKLAADNTGWLEVWVDGVNIYPRKSRPTMWGGDTGMYYKQGLYKQRDARFPETGKSIYYGGRTTIGVDRPF